MRYFPFTFKDKIKNKRKFDNDVHHELRVLEELYYYTYDEESRYISHLKNELRKDGYIRDDKMIKTFALKKEFQESKFYQETKIWYNKQIDNPNRKKKSLDDIKKDFFFPYKIQGLEITEQEVIFDQQEDLHRLNLTEKGLKTISIKFKDIEKHIVQKAINIKAKSENSLFRRDIMSDKVLTLTDSNFEEEVLNSDIPVLVDFWAGWCGPCRMLSPTIDSLAEDYDNRLKVGKLNVDDFGDVAAQYNIMSIPTVYIFENGEPIEKMIGVKSKSEYDEIIKKHI